MADISEGHWLIQVSGITGTFQTKTGGETEVEHTKDFDGGSLVPNIFQGKPNVSDITVSRAFQAPRDALIRKQLLDRLKTGGRSNHTIVATPLNEQMVPTGSPETYDAVLRRVGGREANANSAQPSRLELMFTVRTAS